VIDYSNKGAVSAMRKARGIEHKDRFRIYTGDLKLPKEPDTKAQKLLREGYKIVFRDGKKLAIKGSEEIECV